MDELLCYKHLEEGRRGKKAGRFVSAGIQILTRCNDLRVYFSRVCVHEGVLWFADFTVKTARCPLGRVGGLKTETLADPPPAFEYEPAKLEGVV
jgi:hypothetical protein